MSLKAGDRLGDWIIDTALGAGGMGSVYRCHSVLSVDVLSAVKVLKPSNVSDVEDRFVQEMRTLAQLNHPAIVRVLGGGRDEARGLLYMAMELVDGEDLDGRLSRGPMDAAELSKVFGPVAAALSYAHERGVAHRDIKPGNIMLRRDGSPVIVDFGIALVSGQTRHTRDGMVPGTLVYLPPELFEGEAPDPVSTDAYALGVVMWEAATGETAFEASPQSSEGQQMAAVMGMKLRSESLDPGASVPDGLREAVLRTTDPDPDTRLTDLDAVRELVAGRPETVELPPRRRTTGSRRRKRARSWLVPALLATLVLLLLIGGGVVTVVAGAGAAGAWWFWGTPPPQERRARVDLDEALGRVASAAASGDRVEARVHAGFALDDHPEDPHANLAYGQILLAEGELLLARPYLCAAVAGGLGAQVPGHADGQLDCERGPGASLPLTSPVALAQLDVSAALADLSSLTSARQGDASADLGEGVDDEADEEALAAAPRASAPRRADAPSPEAAPEAPAREPVPEPSMADAGDVIGAGSGAGSSSEGLASKSKRADTTGYGSEPSTVVPVASVSFQGLDVDGPHDKDQIKRLLSRSRASIRQCYAQAITSDPSLTGRIVFTIVIGSKGYVTSLEITDDSVGGAVAACAKARLKRITFPATAAGTSSTASLTLVFTNE